MKKFLIISFLLIACKTAPQQSVTDDKDFQLKCEQTFTHCVNQCHHTASSNGEEFDCIQSCKTSAKKCGK